MLGETRSMLDRQLPDTDSLVNTVRTKVERVLPLDPQLPPYGTRSGYSLEDTLRELTQEPDRALVADPCKVYPTGMRGTTRFGEERAVREKTMYLSLNHSSGADLRYTEDKRSDIDEDLRRKRYRKKKRDGTYSPGGEYKSKKHSDTSDSDGSNSDDVRDDKPDRGKSRSHRHISQNH